MRNAEHSQYGNNFYFLFYAVKNESTNPNSPIIEVYLRRAEKLFGTNWSEFLSENSELINEVFIALEGVEVYSTLLREYKDLLKNREWDKADEFEANVNMEQIGILAWNVLNPLLEEVGKAMTKYGIDERKFWK